MTLPGFAFILGGISLLAGLVLVQPVAIVLGLLVMVIAWFEGRES